MFEEDFDEEKKKIKESSIYENDGRDELLESDAIEPEEEGFMQGYENEETVICGFCKKPIVGSEDIVEKEYNNKIFRFCSDSCFEEYDSDLESG